MSKHPPPPCVAQEQVGPDSVEEEEEEEKRRDEIFIIICFILWKMCLMQALYITYIITIITSPSPPPTPYSLPLHKQKHKTIIVMNPIHNNNNKVFFLFFYERTIQITSTYTTIFFLFKHPTIKSTQPHTHTR